MVCRPRRCATCNGSRSNSPRAACTFTVSRTESPVCTQSGVTRCERCASYAAITRETPTYSFPSAADQSAPSVSTASFSASGRPPRCHSRSTRTCFAMPAGSSWPMMAMTPGPCSTTSGTRTSSTRSDTPKWRPTGSRTFGGDLGLGQLAHSFLPLAISRCGLGTCRALVSRRGRPGRRQARDDFRLALDHLGTLPSLLRRHPCLYRRNRVLYLLVRHGFNPAGMLQLHLPRHEQGANLHVGRRLLLTHLFNRGRPMLFEVGSEREQEILVERSTCSLQGTARVS